MSTKKDKFSKKDKNFMRLAINLARARIGLTGDNPSVGCVIVKDDEVISIGQTGYGGRPHAENSAIKNSFQNLKGAKIYVTLEPCNHYGKTPPCTKIIIKSGISEVYYSIDDIDKKVKGKSHNILSRKKIKVKKGLLKDEADKLYVSYKRNRISQLPYVTGKIATSKNKLIYKEGERRITDQTSDKLSHYLRYKNDAIMISSRTLNIDNPKLNCRLKGFEKFSPIRIILDRKLDINYNSYIIKSAKNTNTIIFHNSSDLSKINFLKKKKIQLVKSLIDKNKNFDLKKILKKLFVLGIRNLLVEGGDRITKSFIQKRLFDQFYLFISKKKLIKNKKYLIFTSHSILNKNYNINPKISSKLVKDNIIIYKK